MMSSESSPKNSSQGYIKNNFGIIILAVVSTIIVPQLFYISNKTAFSNDVILAFIPLFMGGSLCVAGYLLRIGFRLQLLLAGLGISILLNDFFFRPEFTSIDGGEFLVEIDSKVATINALLFLSIPSFLLILGDRIRRVLSDLGIVSIFLGAGLSVYTLVTSTGGDFIDSNADTVWPQGVAERPRKMPNVYFIWLDAMQAEYFGTYLRDNDRADSYGGFTFYENNVSNYLYSIQSQISFMSGSLFDGGDYDRWATRSDDLRKALIDSGYSIKVYAKKDFLSALDVDPTTPIDLLAESNKVYHPFTSDFVTFWIVKILPIAVMDFSMAFGDWLGDLAHQMINFSNGLEPVIGVGEGIEPLGGVATLKTLIVEEQLRSSDTSAVIAQAIIPHGPYVIDRNCDYISPRPPTTSEAYFDQVFCAAQLLEQFLSSLRSQDKYDSSLIIVMSDHGDVWSPSMKGRERSTIALNSNYTNWSEDQLIARSRSLLMIKPPGRPFNDPFTVSTEPTQLIDIYPTIFEYLNLEPLNFEYIDGRVVGTASPLERKSFLTYFKPAKIIDSYESTLYEIVRNADGRPASTRYVKPLKSYDFLQELGCNQEVRFSDASHADLYNQSGMGKIEEWGRWSETAEVKLYFNISSESCIPSQLKLSIKGMVSDDHPVQTAEVYFNNEALGSISYTLSSGYEKIVKLQLPIDVARTDAVNTLSFTLNDSISPLELGLGNDPRSLGIRFISMTLESDL